MTDATVLYYSASRLPERFAQAVLESLAWHVGDCPVITVTQRPLDYHDWPNLCVGDLGVSVQNVYRQILIGAEAARTEYVVCCEDDTLYPREHFAYRPKPGVFAYNLNRWHLDPTDPPVYRWRNRTGMCACVCHRQDLIDTLEARFAADPGCRYPKTWGEPGKYEWKFGIPKVERETFRTEQPVIHVNHGGLGGVRLRVKTDVVSPTLPGWPSAAKLWEELGGRG